MTEVVTAPIVSPVDVRRDVHQSRWGFHPCSRDVDKQLRFLNFVYSKAQAADAAEDRWCRKLKPKGHQPATCPMFLRDEYIWVDTTPQGQPPGKRRIKILSDRGIRAAARLARMPVATPELVPTLPLSVGEIALLVIEGEAWLEEVKPSRKREPGER